MKIKDCYFRLLDSIIIYNYEGELIWAKMRVSSTFVAIIFMVNYLVGCTNNNEVYNNVEEIKIGVTVYKEDDKFISTITNNILELAKKKEKEENVKITIDILDAKKNLANQCNQVDKFILNNYDVICVNIVDRTSAATIIDKAKSSNTPIIFFEIGNQLKKI